MARALHFRAVSRLAMAISTHSGVAMTDADTPSARVTERPKAILCLCNDSDMLRIRRMLLEHFGYIVLPTTSVEDAKNVVENQCPDMLLMDNAEPGIDYRKLAEQVKQIC